MSAESLPIAGPRSEILWDAPVLNEDGTPVTDLNHYEIIVTAGTVHPGSEEVARTTTVLTTQRLVYLIEHQPEGDYTVWVRAVDNAGNRSQWVALHFQWDVTATAAPVNLRMIEV